jgi:hypothetical protein
MGISGVRSVANNVEKCTLYYAQSRENLSKESWVARLERAMTVESGEAEDDVQFVGLIP